MGHMKIRLDMISVHSSTLFLFMYIHSYLPGIPDTDTGVLCCRKPYLSPIMVLVLVNIIPGMYFYGNVRGSSWGCIAERRSVDIGDDLN